MGDILPENASSKAISQFREGMRNNYAEEMKSRVFPEWRHVLIDYKNENEHVKAKMMTVQQAAEKNKLLQGSGFAWARCSK